MTEATRPTASRAPADVPIDGGHRPPHPSSQVPAAAEDSALSWELAMARAEAGPATAEAPAGSWSPFDKAPAAGSGPLPGSADEPAERLAAAPFTGTGGQAAAAAGSGLADPGVTPDALSAQDLREYKWERLLMGLDPAANAAGMALDPTATAAVGLAPAALPGDPLAAGFRFAPPVGGLAESDRPVMEGRSLVELVADHHVQTQREVQVAQDIGAAALSQQLHLEVVNTPEPLPLETIKSV